MNFDLGRNWKYEKDFEYEYDTEYSCEESGCDDICRCSRIIDLKITSVGNVFKHVVDAYLSAQKNKKINDEKSEIDLYCIDRILASHNIQSEDAWEVEIEGGYYGEEVGSFCMREARLIGIEIESLLNFETTKEKIEYVLSLEYNDVLYRLRDRNWKIKTVSKSKTSSWRNKLVPALLERYAKYHDYYDGKLIPIGIFTETNGFYDIVDGHHRIHTTSESEIKVFVPTDA